MIRPFNLATAFVLAVSVMPLTITEMVMGKSDHPTSGLVFIIGIGAIWINAYAGLGGTFQEIGTALKRDPSIEGE